MAKYRINSTVPTVDGSGDLVWNMSALYDNGEVIPWMETPIRTPADEVQTALGDPNPDAALLALLGAHAPEYFLPAALDTMEVANTASLDIKESLDDVITSYPHEFDV